MTERKYEFNIIHEAVASDDLFPDKTHEKVASTLFDLIQNSDRGVTIGLEGGWGSGKSSVVNFVKREVSENGDDTLFFLFDAWAHEGDPLRRIFLESLIEKVDPSGGDSFLGVLKQKISGRKKTVSVDMKKTTSRLGGFVSLSAIFVPLGAAILSALDYSKIIIPWNEWGQSPHLPFIAGLLLTLAPLWILIWWFFCGERDKSGKVLWDLFASDSLEKYTQDITQDSERTSIEFENFFQQIMVNSIGEGKKYKKALIVIDNLDRVEPDQTLFLWSILQTFFQHRNNQASENAWQSKLWFLIPYDREGLSKVWNRNGTSPDPRRPEEAILETGPAASTNMYDTEEFAHSFLEKSFQIVAEVPEPVMSAWAEYCEGRIKNALTGWPDNEVLEVIDTYKRFESRLDASPTPRQMHSFVNRVGILGMRWGSQMDAEAIALYALLRKNRSDRELRKALLLNGIPDDYEGKGDELLLKKQLAGMLFGVDADKGIQLLLEPDIKSALLDGDSGRIKSLIEANDSAFWIVWQSIQDSSLPRGHVEEYRITVTKAFCGGVFDHRDKAVQSINRLIEEWKNTVHKWELEQYDYSEALEVLLALASDPTEMLDWLTKVVNTSIKEVVSSIDNKEFDSTILVHLEKLIILLNANDVQLKSFHYPKLEQANWQLWLDALRSRNIVIPVILPAKGTIQALASLIGSNSPSKDTVSLLLSTLPYLPNDKEWSLVADQIGAWLINPNRDIDRDDIYELMLKIHLNGNRHASEKFKESIKHPNYTSKSQQENVTQNPNLLTLYALTFKEKLQSSDSPQTVKQFWQTEFNTEEHSPLIDILKTTSSLSVVWLLATDSNNKMAIGIVKRGEVDSDIYESEIGAERIDEFEWATAIELKEIVEKLSTFGGLAKSRNTLVSDSLVYKGCLNLIKLYGGKEGALIVEEALNNTTSVQWTKALSEDKLLFDCIDTKGNHEFKDGFLALAKSELDTGSLSEHVWDEFGIFYSKLMDKEDVAKSLTQDYFALEVDPLSDQAFGEFSPIASSHLTAISSDLLISRVENWLMNVQWNRLDWLLGSDVDFEDEPTESLVSRVETLIAEGHEDQRDLIESIIEVFNINIDHVESPNTDSD